MRQDFAPNPGTALKTVPSIAVILSYTSGVDREQIAQEIARVFTARNENARPSPCLCGLCVTAGGRGGYG